MAPRWTIASSLVLVSSSAFAQADPIAAEVLFREGKRLMAEKKFAEACPKLAESQRLDPGGGTLLNLALCHEGEGKIVTAWSEFKEALRVSRDSRPDRVKIAEERIAALEPKLPHLTIQVRARASRLSIKVDDLPRNEATWGMALPIDPGEHKIIATADGRKPWTSTVTLAVAESKTIVCFRQSCAAAPGCGGTRAHARRGAGSGGGRGARVGQERERRGARAGREVYAAARPGGRVRRASAWW